jgi:hypothetical protein
MIAARLTDNITTLQKDADVSASQDLNVWRDRIVSSSDSSKFIEELNFEISDINPFAGIADVGKPTSDADLAFSLYKIYQPEKLGRCQYDLGFWQWLSIATDWGLDYTVKRWDNPVRQVFGQGLRKQSLARLWLAGHMVGRGRNIQVHGEYIHRDIKVILKKTDIYDTLISRSIFTDSDTLLAFVRYMDGKDIPEKNFRNIVKRLRYVSSNRIISGLSGAKNIEREIESIANIALKM